MFGMPRMRDEGRDFGSLNGWKQRGKGKERKNRRSEWRKF
jgi:hypothetical protein